MAFSKVILNGTTLIDLTNDTAEQNEVLASETFHQNDGTIGTGSYTPVTINNQNKTITPTEAQQEVTADSGYTGLDTVTVEGISSTYVGSGITQRSSSDLTTSDATVTVPAGYYSVSATKSIANGTEGTPIATKGTIGNNSVTVTPSVTNTAGYISGGTKTGTTVTVSASELVSGTKSIAANGTGIDVTNYASVDVNVSGGVDAFVDTVEQLVGGGDHHIITGVDISSDTVTAEHLEQGYTAHDSSGNAVVGTLVAGGGWTDDDVAIGDISGSIVLSNSVTTIKRYAFLNCPEITSVSGDAVTIISEGAFKDCTNLESVSFPNVTNVGSFAFSGCTKLKRISFPNATAIQDMWLTANAYGGRCFRNCTSLEEVTFKGAYITNRMELFIGCTALRKVNLPDLSALYGNAQFSGCTSLEGIVLPSYGAGSNANYQISANWFLNCSSLEYFDSKGAYAIATAAFSGCASLTTIVIRNANRTTTLNNIDAFKNSPFASDGTGGTLYVPESRLSDYESATNWSTILGYTNNQIKSIESTHTDPNAPIDLTLYYADGTLIPT